MLFVILDFKHLCEMSRFFNIPRFRVILKCIRNYPKVRNCRNEAIRVKELGYYDKVPGQLGLVNDIIKNLTGEKNVVINTNSKIKNENSLLKKEYKSMASKNLKLNNLNRSQLTAVSTV